MVNVDTTNHLGFVKKTWMNSATRAFIIWLIKKRLKYKEIYQVENLWQRPTSPEIVRAWKQVFAELDRLILQVHAGGIELAVIIYPYKEQLKQPESSYPQEILGEFLKRRNIRFLDMLPIYRGENVEPEKIFMDSNHFTLLGSAETALHINRFLSDNKLIPVEAPSVKVTSQEN